MMTNQQIVRPPIPGLPPDANPGNTPGSISSMPRPIQIAPSRPQLDRRDPSLSFQVTSLESRFFDVIVATDPALFREDEVHRRTAKNFRTSRQDLGEEPIDIETGFYMVPRAFLRDVVSVEPKPGRLYYLAIGYSDVESSHPAYSTPRDALETAPYVILSPGLTAESLSRVLGMAVERLGAVNAQGQVVAPRRDPAQVETPRMIGGLPLPPRNPSQAHPPQQSAPQPPVQPPLQARPQPRAPMAQPRPEPRPDSPVPPPATARPASPPSAQPPAQPPVNGTQDAPPPANGSSPQITGAASEEGGFVDDDMSYGLPKDPNQPTSTPGFRDLDHGAPTAQMAYDDGFGAMSFEVNGAAPPREPAAAPIPPMDPAPEAPPQQAAPAPVPAPAPAPMPAPAAPHPTDVSQGDALVQLVIERGAGNRYDALNLDGAYRGRAGQDHPYFQRAHEGLRFGPHQVSQDSGEMGELLHLMQSADPASFERIFGASSAQLVEMTTAPGPSSLEVPGGRSARVQPLEGKDLWEDPWASRFREAAQHAPFQAAMRAHIIARRLEPVMPMAEALGLDDSQARAMVLALSIHYGSENTQAALRQAINPFDSPARIAAALEAVGAASLTAFQQAQGLPISETMNAETHFALIAALRVLGPQGPVPLPDREAAKDMLVTTVPPGTAGDALLKLRMDETLIQQGGEI